MNTTIIIYSISVLGGISITIALLLSYAAKKFKVETDPRKDILLSILPGANCAACGYPGCEQYADALLSSNVDVSLCKPGGVNVSTKIAELLGRDVKQQQRMVAVVMCAGGNRAKDQFIYSGIQNCKIAVRFYKGQKKCEFGCLGFGDCVEVCPFGAIYINSYGVAEVDILKCTGCGLCVKVCPKNIIKLVPCNFQTHILCSSTDKGVTVKQICSVGCIGCGLCVKVCPVNDIVLQNNLALMKYNKCDNCGACVVKCPTKCIVGKNGKIINEQLQQTIQNFSPNIAK